jgi:hypothetical protein
MFLRPTGLKWLWISLRVLVATTLAYLTWRFLVEPWLHRRAVEKVADTIPDGIALLEADQTAFEVEHAQKIEEVRREMATARHDAVVDEFRQRFRLPPRLP